VSRAARGVAAAVLLLAAAGRATAQDVASLLAPWSGRRVSAIELQGNDHTREYVIRREIRTPAGEPLDPALAAADVQRLDNLAIFAEVRVEATPVGPEDVTLRYVFKEMPAWIPVLGMLYTEENGFSIGPGISFANLTGRDVSLSGRTYFGGTRQYWGRFQNPWMGGDHRSLEVYFAHLTRPDEIRGFEETSNELTPRVGRYLGEHGRVSAAFSLFQMESDVPGITLDPDNEDTLLRVGGRLGWDDRDSWLNPRRGWLSELEVWRTGFGGDARFWTGNLDLRRYFAPKDGQRVLVSTLVTLQSGTLGDDVPVYMDFTMGGANTIRGYSVDLGHTLAGRNQWLGTAEYSFNVMPLRRFDVSKFAFKAGLDLALFADAGIAWNEAPELALNRARGGLGAGLRLLVPGTEMLRFDVGWSPTSGLHFHFGSGTKPAAQRQRLR
jgi:outer membrane protein insertion porin family